MAGVGSGSAGEDRYLFPPTVGVDSQQGPPVFVCSCDIRESSGRTETVNCNATELLKLCLKSLHDDSSFSLAAHYILRLHSGTADHQYRKH